MAASGSRQSTEAVAAAEEEEETGLTPVTTDVDTDVDDDVTAWRAGEDEGEEGEELDARVAEAFEVRVWQPFA